MKVYQLKACARMTRRVGIDDAGLSDAIKRAARGQIDADLGGNLIKQRIARPGAGKSGGHCYLIAFRNDHRAVFLFGFPKNAKDNITDDELNAANTLGASCLKLTDAKIDQAVEDKQLIKVEHDDEDEGQHTAPEPPVVGDEAER